jgi:GT2 family glycosyltransferase
MIGRRVTDQSYEVSVPPGLHARWLLATFRLPRTWQLRMARLHLIQHSLSMTGQQLFMRALYFGGVQCWTCVLYAPQDTDRLRLELMGTAELPDEISFSLRPVSRPVAALVIAICHPVRLFLASVTHRFGSAGGIRTALARVSLNTEPASYQDWIELFDTWQAHDHARLLSSTRRDFWPTVGVCVFDNKSDDGQLSTSPASRTDSLRATEQSLLGQIFPCPYCVVGRTNDAATLATALTRLDCEYIALLQAGEVLPSYALALLADQVVSLGRPLLLYADEDEIAEDGTRQRPLFKPEPNHALMLSGTLSRGVWLVRRDVILRHAGIDVRWAEIARLNIWFGLYERDATVATRRVPYILTHRRANMAAAPSGELAACVAGHLARMAIPARVQPSWPLRVDIIAPEDRQPDVSIVVPSACRASHVIRCLSAVLTRTRYLRFELIVVISQTSPLDDRQQEVVTQLSQDPRFRYIVVEQESFNYALANNAAVGATDSPLICLLNDDVEPKDPDWLARMVGHLCDPRVGVVGAKLEYPNGLLQHGGVIIGLAGPCEHANRFLPRNQPGYAWRAVLDQELSAVTGACLLVRRTLYGDVHGMDETYPSAFNDVDLCLKVRESGYAVILCATTELIHFESLSFGSHYTGDNADARQARDIRRLLARWPAVYAADPFHNPNLSLLPGSEWALAFPPRVSKPPLDEDPSRRATASIVGHGIEEESLQT